MGCQTCGMATADPGEFHPYAFCMWVKAGLDPWSTLLDLNTRLGLDTTHWPKKVPLIRDLRPAHASTSTGAPR